MRYAFIWATLNDPDINGLPIEDRCRIMEVSDSGYYHWRARTHPPSKPIKKPVAANAAAEEARSSTPCAQNEKHSGGVFCAPKGRAPAPSSEASPEASEDCSEPVPPTDAPKGAEPSQPASEQPKRRKIVSEEIIIGTANTVRKSLGYTPGYRQMRVYLRGYGVHVGVKRLRRVLRDHGIIGYRHRKRFVRTTDSNHCLPVFPNLLNRNFAVGELHRAWVSDITYLPLPNGRYWYLCTFMDLGSRRILGYSIGSKMDTPFVLEALDMAVQARLQEGLDVAGTIVHSDQGTQYCSRLYQTYLGENDLVCSMSRRSECWDNAPGESIWSSVKRETLIGHSCYQDEHDCVRKVMRWIDLYNSRRPHSSIGMQSPINYEALLLKAS